MRSLRLPAVASKRSGIEVILMFSLDWLALKMYRANSNWLAPATTSCDGGIADTLTVSAALRTVIVGPSI